jgi:uncharacterized protein (TIGR02678 family)
MDTNLDADPSDVDLGLRTRRRLMAGDRLRDATSQEQTEERQQALRALLMYPILSASEPLAETFRLVSRHAGELRDWLARMAGWTLVMQTDLLRLRKTPAWFDDCTRSARDPGSETPFTKSRYSLLCLVLAVLENEDRQTTLQIVAQRAQMLADSDSRLSAGGFEFDLANQGCRRDLVCVIRLLKSLGVLSQDDGDDQQFIEGTGDALYRVERPPLAAMLCVSRPPCALSSLSWTDRLAALHETEQPDTDEAHNLQLRHHLVRRLLDEPVLYLDQLTQQQADYLTNQRAYLLGEVARATGLQPEVRREGIALLDPYGDATDTGLPESGTRGHATLLMAEWFAARLRSEQTRGASWEDVDRQFAKLTDEHAAHWRRGVDQPAAREALARDVVFRLESLGLVTLRHGEIWPLPAVARFALGAPR